jgi:hypothetical protein
MEKETGLQWLEVVIRYLIMAEMNKIDDLNTLKEIKETIKTANDISDPGSAELKNYCILFTPYTWDPQIKMRT